MCFLTQSLHQIATIKNFTNGLGCQCTSCQSQPSHRLSLKEMQIQWVIFSESPFGLMLVQIHCTLQMSVSAPSSWSPRCILAALNLSIWKKGLEISSPQPTNDREIGCVFNNVHWLFTGSHQNVCDICYGQNASVFLNGGSI